MHVVALVQVQHTAALACARRVVGVAAQRLLVVLERAAAVGRARVACCCCRSARPGVVRVGRESDGALVLAGRALRARGYKVGRRRVEIARGW